MSKKANSMMRRRILFAAAVFGLGAFAIVAGRLFQLQVLDHEFYEEKAIAQQTRDKTIEPTRGTIYDCNMKPLAISASAEMVTLEPRKIADDEQAQVISENLANILGMEYDEVYAKASKTDSAYEVIQRGVEKEVADQVRAFEEEYNNVLNQYITVLDTPYQKYLKESCSDVTAVHKGYFSIDTKTGHSMDSQL